ncbi:helix-turn-helix domain-containing protein [Caulobacter segnis]|uniref:Transcriptional regulator, AraC family n=2 Tax=Caulobacter segnis TaxID=88688 RepID=D5VLN9_CAUST|nr:AraC family transcriptional regulator [Caulobacter segnis]ADG11412.1 transcriptional regulator, AraC family [Caulobacter segnis ATCC 21756]
MACCKAIPITPVRAMGAPPRLTLVIGSMAWIFQSSAVNVDRFARRTVVSLVGDQEPAAADAVPGLGGEQAMHLARLVVNAQRRLAFDSDGARALLHQATAILAAQIERLEEEPAVGRLAPWRIRRAVRFIDENIGRRFQIRELAAAVRLSPAYFSHAFRESFGRSAKAYVIERRIERAKRLMAETNDSLVEVARACGFADQAHFSRTFHLLVGDTPSRWRRALSLAPGEADWQSPSSGEPGR